MRGGPADIAACERDMAALKASDLCQYVNDESKKVVCTPSAWVTAVSNDSTPDFRDISEDEWMISMQKHLELFCGPGAGDDPARRNVSPGKLFALKLFMDVSKQFTKNERIQTSTL